MILRFITNKNQFQKLFDFSSGKSDLKNLFFINLTNKFPSIEPKSMEERVVLRRHLFIV